MILLRAQRRAGMKNRLRAYQSGLVGRPRQATLTWKSAPDHVIEKKKKMRPSSDNQKKPLIFRPWSSWRTWTIMICTGRATWQSVINSRGFWSTLVINSRHKWPRNQQGQMLLNLILKNNYELVSNMKTKGILGCRVYEVVEFRITKGRGQQGAQQNRGSQPWTSGGQTLPCSGTWLEESFVIWSWTKQRSRRAGWFWRITFCKFKKGPS